MINRSNEQLVVEYLKSRKKKIKASSLNLANTQLRLLLEFADETTFSDLPKCDRTFAEYVCSSEARRDGKTHELAYEYCRKVILEAKHFFEWLRDIKGYRAVSTQFLETFEIQRPPGSDEDQELFTLDEILKIISVPCRTTLEERTRASCAFLFLSGMRIAAFLTLPIMAVDLNARTIQQWPSLGVHTKLGKTATTKLLDIPEPLEIIIAWDNKVRSLLPPEGLWFAPLSPLTGEIDPNAKVGRYRSSGFVKDLACFLDRAAVQYKSPHKFRHGHIRFLRDKAVSTRDLESIAKNAMQTLPNMLKYARLSSREAHEGIDTLCARGTRSTTANKQGDPDHETIRWVLEYLKRKHQS